MAHTYNTALVVEGGALRSVFSSGVLDGFIEHRFNPFDFYIGVSAGAGNLAFYKAGIHGRSFRIFIELIKNNNFINYRRFIAGGHLLDLDWLFDSYFDESIIDVDRAFDTQNPLYICMTEVVSGRPRYEIATPNNFLSLIKASTALPLIYRHFPEVDGEAMADGGVADGIPVKKAISLGAKKIIVVRARHYAYLKKDTLGHRLIRWKSRKHSFLVDTMRERVDLHKQSIDLIRHPPGGVKIIEICPPESFDIGRFSRNSSRLKAGYEEGRSRAEKAIADWNVLSE